MTGYIEDKLTMLTQLDEHLVSDDVIPCLSERRNS